MAENRDEPVKIMAASFSWKTMLLPQVLWAVLKRFISAIDHKYAENMRCPRPRLDHPNSFSGQSLGMNFVTQTNVWSQLATMRPAVSSTVFLIFLPKALHKNKSISKYHKTKVHEHAMV